jgi:hypothetical protein
MGPEYGGLIALGMIGFVAVIIAWMNCGTCRLGRHEWGTWSEPKVSTKATLLSVIAYAPNKHHYTWKHFQERRCKKCNKDSFRYYRR